MDRRLDQILPGQLARVGLLLDTLLVLTVAGLLLVDLNSTAACLVVAPVATGSWFFGAAVLRLYSPCTPRAIGDELVLRFGISAVVLGVTWAAAALLGTLAVEVQPLDAFLILYGLGVLLHIWIARGLPVRRSEAADRVVIVGVNALGEVTHSQLASLPAPREVVGYLRFAGEPRELPANQAPILGDADDLLEVLASHSVSEVFIAGRVTVQGEAMQRVVDACESIGMPFAVPLHSLRLGRAALLSSVPSDDGFLHYMTIKPKPFQYAVKRLLDIVGSAVALLLLSPLLVAVAVIIKLTSPGPVLFRQVRVGLHGSQFNLLKFRSMVTDAEALRERLATLNEQTGPVFKMVNDPRITSIGRFIRKYSIDELPQLINILRGDMTIVGPRPALPSEVAQYKTWQRRRLSVRPGLTCYWQVGGRNAIGFEEWMLLDLRYVDNWSLMVDARLILQTFPVVLTGSGAS